MDPGIRWRRRRQRTAPGVARAYRAMSSAVVAPARSRTWTALAPSTGRWPSTSPRLRSLAPSQYWWISSRGLAHPSAAPTRCPSMPRTSHAVQSVGWVQSSSPSVRRSSSMRPYSAAASFHTSSPAIRFLESTCVGCAVIFNLPPRAQRQPRWTGGWSHRRRGASTGAQSRPRCCPGSGGAGRCRSAAPHRTARSSRRSPCDG